MAQPPPPRLSTSRQRSLSPSVYCSLTLSLSLSFPLVRYPSLPPSHLHFLSIIPSLSISVHLCPFIPPRATTYMFSPGVCFEKRLKILFTCSAPEFLAFKAFEVSVHVRSIVFPMIHTYTRHQHERHQDEQSRCRLTIRCARSRVRVEKEVQTP